VPNAGKSTLLDAVTNAKPKIASYPFTTIVPNLGVCEVGKVDEGGEALVIADIPGLLEGAHKGVGLGRGFLRHIERCKIVIHIVNGESEDPLGDFTAINNELQLFSPLLAAKPQVVVLNKVDLPHVAAKKEELMKGLLARMSHTRLLSMSAAGRIGVDDLIDKTNKFLRKIKRDEEIAAERAREAAMIAAAARRKASGLPLEEDDDAKLYVDESE
jgi:GTP-binding protein